MGKILPKMSADDPRNPFSGGQIIFAVGPNGISRPNSTQPPPATSEAEADSAPAGKDDTRGKSEDHPSNSNT